MNIFNEIVSPFSNHIHDNTQSTSLQTGALIVDGGVSIDKNLWMGGDFRTTSLENSTGVSTGALISDGGLSVALDTYLIGDLHAQSGIDVNSNKITSLADGVNANDAVNKSQLDTLATYTGGDGIDITSQVISVDNTVLRTTDLGVSVEAYDATILKDADIGVSVQAYDATIVKTTETQTLTNKTFDDTLTISSGNIIDFDNSTGNKIDFYGGSYLIGIDSATLFYDCHSVAKHSFRVGTVEKFYINTSKIDSVVPLDMNSNLISNVSDPISSGDAVNLSYLNAHSGLVPSITNNEIVTGTGSSIQGESNLTFDGSDLDLTGSLSLHPNGTTDYQFLTDYGTRMTLKNTNTGEAGILRIRPNDADGTDNCELQLVATSSGSAQDYLELSFKSTGSYNINCYSAGASGTTYPLIIKMDGTELMTFETTNLITSEVAHTFADTTQSTTTTSGSIICSGGFGLAKDMFTGGNIWGDASSNLYEFANLYLANGGAVYGGQSASDDLILESTSNGLKGNVIIASGSNFQSNDLDTNSAVALNIGASTATSVSIGASDITTSVNGELNYTGGYYMVAQNILSSTASTMTLEWTAIDNANIFEIDLPTILLNATASGGNVQMQLIYGSSTVLTTGYSWISTNFNYSTGASSTSNATSASVIRLMTNVYGHATSTSPANSTIKITNCDTINYSAATRINVNYSGSFINGSSVAVQYHGGGDQIFSSKQLTGIKLLLSAGSFLAGTEIVVRCMKQ